MNKNELRERLVEDINDVPFDMLDEFDAKQIADACMYLADGLDKKDVAEEYIVSRQGVEHYIKVINMLKGSVSVSTSDGTGVSRTEYYPYYKDDEGQPWDGLFNLAEMINEAWYHLGQIR